MLSKEVKDLEMENQKLRRELETLNAELKETKPMACAYCKFYMRHYVRVDGEFVETYQGHCIHGRMKKRNVDETCGSFRRKEI